jgi:hypothetical protein
MKKEVGEIVNEVESMRCTLLTKKSEESKDLDVVFSSLKTDLQ